jgi:erythromycin esterase-like protein
VRGRGSDRDADEALSGFRRFPNWMWRNTDVAAFVQWLRHHNEAAAGTPVGFYGLDLYSMFTSIEEVLRYLDQVDPNAARQARERYACFDHYHEDSQHYGYTASLDLSASCEQGVLEQLRQLQQRASDYMHRDGDEEAFFYAQQNARLVKNAEEYYRTMFRGRVSSWNLRDSHMAETLDALAHHLSKDGAPAKIVVWEHNSHIGDARATEMGEMGEWNVGELARKEYDGQTRLIGFSTYDGFVTAASEWDARPSTSASGRACRAVTRHCCTKQASPASCCRCAKATTSTARATRCWNASLNGRSASSTCRARSATVIISRPRWRASSMP